MTATQTTARSTTQTPNSNRGFGVQFLDSIPRHNPLVLDGVIASIDGIRMKFVFQRTAYDYESRQKCDTLDKLLRTLTSESLWLEGLFDFSTTSSTFKLGNYAHTIHYTHTDGWAFSVLAGRYAYGSSSKRIAPEVILDVNPNKVPYHAWGRIAGIIRGVALEVSIQRYDLAMDFPQPRSSFELQRRSGSEFSRFEDRQGAATEYTGERSHHAAVKLYDKAAEAGIDTDCTRLEITIDPKKFKGISELFPTILTSSDLSLDTSFDDLPYEVKSVLICPQLYPVLKASVGRTTWYKHKKLIEGYGQPHGQAVLALSATQQNEIDRYVRSYLARLISGTEGGAA